ncbi:hypothetical protein ACPXCG_12220 [Gordonia sp. DT218]|uniref:hypothetical protein n=1 Tax=unclassified Gordonia (in: high G+C Gram-positive bacteria) TaxID=2657482 RepID=UPI003CF24A8D
MDPSGPRNYELLAEVLTEALASVPDAERCAEQAGRIWGEQCAPHGVDPIADLLVVLGDFGFAPEATDSGIRLNRCPFLELARDHPGVTCAVHLGIMQGVLASHASPVHLAGLEAFVDADHCFATVTTGGRP